MELVYGWQLSCMEDYLSFCERVTSKKSKQTKWSGKINWKKTKIGQIRSNEQKYSNTKIRWDSWNRPNSFKFFAMPIIYLMVEFWIVRFVNMCWLAVLIFETNRKLKFFFVFVNVNENLLKCLSVLDFKNAHIKLCTVICTSDW